MNQELYIQVARYYKREMDEAERRSLENRLLTDSDFKSEMIAHSLMYESVQQKGDHLLEQRLLTYGQQLAQRRPTSKIRSLSQRNTWMIAMAAAVVLLMSFVFIINRGSQPQELYAVHFKPLSDDRSDRSSLTNQGFMQAYNQQDYQKAINIFEQELANTPAALQADVNLYLGISYLAIDQAEDAKHALLRVSDDTPALYDDAIWYLALAQLKLEEIEPAREKFQTIASDRKNEWRAKAQAILDEL